MTVQFQNETGEGTLTMYEVFPGVILSYNDFHMAYYDSEYQPDRSLFCIDHCREGRLEYTAAEDAYAYVAAGDLKLDKRLTHTGRFEMPLSHLYCMHSRIFIKHRWKKSKRSMTFWLTIWSSPTRRKHCQNSLIYP